VIDHTAFEETPTPDLVAGSSTNPSRVRIWSSLPPYGAQVPFLMQRQDAFDLLRPTVWQGIAGGDQMSTKLKSGLSGGGMDGDPRPTSSPQIGRYPVHTYLDAPVLYLASSFSRRSIIVRPFPSSLIDLVGFRRCCQLLPYKYYLPDPPTRFNSMRTHRVACPIPWDFIFLSAAFCILGCLTCFRLLRY